MRKDNRQCIIMRAALILGAGLAISATARTVSAEEADDATVSVAEANSDTVTDASVGGDADTEAETTAAADADAETETEVVSSESDTDSSEDADTETTDGDETAAETTDDETAETVSDETAAETTDDETAETVSDDQSQETVSDSQVTETTSDSQDAETASDSQDAETVSGDQGTDEADATEEVTVEAAAPMMMTLQSTAATTYTTTWHGIDFSAIYDYTYYTSQSANRVASGAANSSVDDATALENYIRYDLLNGTIAKAGLTAADYTSYQEKMKLIIPNIDNMITVYKGTDYSLVYDYAYYLYNNQDVAAVSEGDPTWAIWHFLTYGMKEQRQAIVSFDEKSYRRAYQDLRKAFGNNYASYYYHYINSGSSEGRSQLTGVTAVEDPVSSYNGVDLSPVYDYNYYISNNADLKAAFGENDFTAIWHFVKYGLNEGRSGKADYDKDDYTAYRLVMPNVSKATSVYNKTDYSPVYNYVYYALNNVDVTKAFGGSPTGVLQHFVTYGMKEERQGCATFDEKSYRRAYQDLRVAYGSNYRNYYIHYMLSGMKEGRDKLTGITEIQDPILTYHGVNLSSVYDYYYYVANYADMEKVFGESDANIIAHFVNYGLKEGRIGKEDYDTSYYSVLKNISETMKDAVTTYKGEDYSAVYEYFYYAAVNDDLNDEFNFVPSKYVEHFVMNGIKEGRKGKANVTVYAYIKAKLYSQSLNGTSTYLNGIDIFGGTGTIDYSTVPCDFVIVKATQGSTFTNPLYESQITAAQNAGKLTGVYHYVSGVGAEAEADYFVKAIKEQNQIGKSIIVLDWESYQNAKWGDISYLKEVFDLVKEKTGITPIIYTSKSYMSAVSEQIDCIFWAAQYADNDTTGYQAHPWNEGSYACAIRQYSGNGRLSGHSGALDLDKFYGSSADWKMLCYA